jgi:ferredoxin--NADP+ reductase
VGTGIAPFRAFTKHIYEERKEWKGKVRLFYGAKTGMDMLYMNDRNSDISNYYTEENFKAFEALSPRPHVDAPVAMDRTIKENATEVWEMVQDSKTYVYVSGLTDLEKKLDSIMSEMAGSEEVWEATKHEMVKQGRWSTLFYD